MGSGNVEKPGRRIVGILGGPTGIGKTAVALEVAERLGLEILSVDTGQSRRGLEIGTAAPTPGEQARVRHHLVSNLSPTETDSVVAFLGRTRAVLGTPGPDLLATGGTGQFLSGLLRGIDPVPASDPDLRQQLLARWEIEGREPLWQELLALNPAPPHDAWQNPVRLLRALEKAVLLARGAPTQAHPALAAGVPVLALELDRPALHQRLDRRLTLMLEAGWRDEVAALEPLPPDAPCWKCIGYPELREVVGVDPLPPRTRERILEATRQYAKRQETWLRNKLEPIWIRADRPVEQIASDMQARLTGGAS
jgi:tRNA dimethylallyltransferase